MKNSQDFYIRESRYKTTPKSRMSPSVQRPQLWDKSAMTLEDILASGLGSRGGPNKVSNKYLRSRRSYTRTLTRGLERLLATGLGSRGGPNKPTNKVKRCPASYVYH